MGCDSQDITLYNNRFVKRKNSNWKKNKIIFTILPNFKGLLGYVGTEKIGEIEIMKWLEKFINNHCANSLEKFCEILTASLSSEWKKNKLKSGLWIFIAGYNKKDACFWYINNIGDMNRETGLYFDISTNFKAVNDLDDNYIKPRLTGTNSKRDILKSTMFNFRNGVIVPFARIYEIFNEILIYLIAHGDNGFRKPNSLKDFAFIAKQRLEFIKRMYQDKKGIYKLSKAPIAGDVSIFTVNNKGEIFECSKNIYQKRR